jgi:hypothetical protein
MSSFLIDNLVQFFFTRDDVLTVKTFQKRYQELTGQAISIFESQDFFGPKSVWTKDEFQARIQQLMLDSKESDLQEALQMRINAVCGDAAEITSEQFCALTLNSIKAVQDWLTQNQIVWIEVSKDCFTVSRIDLLKSWMSSLKPGREKRTA